MTDDPQDEAVEFFTPEPPSHVTNLTPDLPQPEGFKDHRDLVAEAEAAARAYLAEVEAEYGKYRATSDILHNGVVAYRQGQPVPVSNVRLHGYDEQNLVEEVDA